MVPCKIAEYLQDESDTDDELLLSEGVRENYKKVMDIVTPQDNNSMCFTKAYTHYYQGTGSIVSISRVGCGGKKQVFLRFFSSREISNLLGFPKHFKFPADMTNRQRYRVLGNSLNVTVVSHLLNLLLSDCKL